MGFLCLQPGRVNQCWIWQTVRSALATLAIVSYPLARPGIINKATEINEIPTEPCMARDRCADLCVRYAIRSPRELRKAIQKGERFQEMVGWTWPVRWGNWSGSSGYRSAAQRGGAGRPDAVASVR